MSHDATEPGIHSEGTAVTPEVPRSNIASIAVPHTKWLMVRSAPSSQTRRIAGEMNERLKRHLPRKRTVDQGEGDKGKG